MLFQKIANYASLETLFEPLVWAIIQNIIWTTGYLLTKKGAVTV